MGGQMGGDTRLALYFYTIKITGFETGPLGWQAPRAPGLRQLITQLYHYKYKYKKIVSFLVPFQQATTTMALLRVALRRPWE